MKKSQIIAFALGTTVLGSAAMAEDLRMSWWGGDSRHEATQVALEACGAKHEFHRPDAEFASSFQRFV